LPFIRLAARPSRTSATARCAASWSSAASTISKPPMSAPISSAAASVWRRGPTSTGTISPASTASITPLSALASPGHTTAVDSGG
jgi:hypothetical protein